jgi:hypothetical protein
MVSSQHIALQQKSIAANSLTDYLPKQAFF